MKLGREVSRHNKLDNWRNTHRFESVMATKWLLLTISETEPGLWDRLIYRQLFRCPRRTDQFRHRSSRQRHGSNASSNKAQTRQNSCGGLHCFEQISKSSSSSGVQKTGWCIRRPLSRISCARTYPLMVAGQTTVINFPLAGGADKRRQD